MTGSTHALTATHQHVVNFYDVDADLVDAVANYLTVPLSGTDPAVVIATAEHRAALVTALERRRVPVARCISDGRLELHDAASTLALFVVDGRPDPALFREVIGGVIEGLSRQGRPHAFGEMVALLWDEGNVTAAIELESLWNDLATELDFVLYCGYAMPTLAKGGLLDIADVCERHTALVPPVNYTGEFDSGELAAVVRDRVFVPALSSAWAVRRFVAETLATWSLPELIDDAALIGSELATNAVEHATSPFRLVLRRMAAGVRIEAYDVSTANPRRQRPSLDASDGRGLLLIEAIAHLWGSEPTDDGKVVWAQLTLPGLH